MDCGAANHAGIDAHHVAIGHGRSHLPDRAEPWNHTTVLTGNGSGAKLRVRHSGPATDAVCGGHRRNGRHHQVRLHCAGNLYVAGIDGDRIDYDSCDAGVGFNCSKGVIL